MITEPNNRTVLLWLALPVPRATNCGGARERRHVRAVPVAAWRVGHFRSGVPARLTILDRCGPVPGIMTAGGLTMVGLSLG